MNAFPARISFHPWRNCFGFVVDDHTRPKTLAISQPSNGFPLGSFTVCAYSKSCQPLVIDLYSLASSSLEQFCNGHTWMLLLNEKLAFAAGLSGNDQVILERIGETSSCIYVEIRPQSFRDWETVQSSSTEFELTMLNQIGVVCEGMSFPIWIGQNIVSLFTVVNISPLPPPNSGCVRLAEDTEIYVQPYSDYTKGEITEPIAHRDPGDYSQSGFSSAFSRIISRFLPADDTADHCLVDEFIRNISKDSINVNLRILPRSLLDGDIYGSMHPTAIVALSDDSTGCCPRPSIVRIQSFDVKNPAFALLFFLPKDSPSDRRIADTLRGRNSHCILSTYLYEFSLTDCAWIDCSAIDSSHVRVVKHLEVLAAQVQNDLSIGRNEAEESKEVSVESSAGYSENFGESVTDTVALEMQSRHIASCARYIEYCLESGRESPGHVLIVGPELSGKSTIALRLAKRLLKSPKTVLSACIECKRWKVIWRILARSGVLVIATAKSLHAVHRTLATPQGKRFFARVEEIESLEEVSLDLLEAF
ncbi:Peroxisome biogenesis factor 1 [Toxocara canis]|uniref:Peroxisome biogenesis factor 1 n=1 Tax=Toxocara canis TaxID=6265 RepID=A0A0B2VIQ6_TOXCA|nr:Peroxisome biogenesis factor 1 [Toxocara canis]